MSQAEHDRARQELGFPMKLRVNALSDPTPWPGMRQSVEDDEVF